MNLLDAVKTGRPFRRPKDIETYGADWFVDDRWTKDGLNLDREDILADDWQVKPEGADLKRVLSVGRYVEPEDSDRPYFMMLDFFEGKPPVMQPLSEGTMLSLINSVLKNQRVEIPVVVK